MDIDGHAAAQAADTVAERAEASADRSGALLARAMALVLRMISGEVSVTDAPENLCRAALPLEDERDDPRRLALLWSVIAVAAQYRMRNGESVAAYERALRYFRLAGDSPSSGAEARGWGLILGDRPADDGLRMLGEFVADGPPGDGDLTRAVLLAMLGRVDEAWPLAEARADHLRDVTGGAWGGTEYLAAIALIEGDRERARRLHVDLIDALPPGSDGLAATWRLPLARQLCYLGRFDEAQAELQQARAVAGGPVDRALIPAVEALLLTRAGNHGAAEERARHAVATAESETDNVWLQGWSNEDLATVLERAGRIEEAQDALERALAVWERKRCLPCAERVREQLDSLRRAQA